MDETRLYERLFQATVDGVLLTRPDGRVLRANPAACRLLGWTEEEILWLGRAGIVVPDESLARMIAERAAKGHVAGALTMRRADGSLVVVDATSGLLPPGEDPDEGPVAYVAFRDDTARREAEARLRRANRALALLTACDEALVRATSVDDLFRAVCQATVEVGGHRMAWVGVPGVDAPRTVVPVAWAGEGRPYLDEVRIVAADAPLGRGPTGTAMRTGRPSVSRDIAADPAMAPWREAAARHGFRSSAALPLVSEGERVGVLGIYSAHPGAFDDDELDVLQRLAVDLAFGVRALRERAARAVADAALREREAMLAAITEMLPEPLFLKDREGRWTFANPAALRVVGRRLGEVLGRTDAEVYGDAALGARLAEADRRAMVSGATVRAEEVVPTPDGPRHFLATKAPFRDPEGRVVGVVGCATDITDRRRAEADRERLTRAIEQAAEMVVLFDADGSIEYVNPAFERVTGHAPADVLGRHGDLLLGGFDGEEHARLLGEWLERGSTWSGRRQVRRKDGAPFTVDATVAPVRDAAGEIVGFVAVGRDVTRDLAREAELRHAQKMESVGRLAGGIAHDFNNVLSVILGCADLALETIPPDADARDDVEEIAGAARRGAALTRQLLAFSRKQVARPEPVDVGRVVADLDKMLRRVLGEDVALELDLAPSVGLVLVDPAQIEQVIMNLAVNARDAMPAGGTLRIAAQEVDLDASEAALRPSGRVGPHARIVVADTGVGMPGETIAHIFEPFFTTKEQGKGTGLGLSTVYGIVQQSGGHVSVQSAPGRGTTFVVDLPCVARARSAPRADDVALSTPRSTRGEVVLVVEDEEPVRRVAARVLELAGYRVIAAASADEALKLAVDPGVAFDLVLTDVVMPGLGGVGLARRLAEVRPAVKVLFMSGYPGDELARVGGPAPDVLVLPKPLRRAEMLHRVREALDG